MAGEWGNVAELERAARRFATWAWINVGIAVLGGFLTLASYSSASSSGSYVAFKGAIVLGPVFAIINAVRYFRTRSKINAIRAAARGTRPAAQNVPQQAAEGSAPQRPAQVFNPPPGWPRPPEGWMPDPGWKPEPAWPLPPKGWNLLVDPDLLMDPVSLNEDLDFGPPARVTKKRLNEAADGAADAIAWQICRAASERAENPLVTVANAPEHLGTALDKAKERIFTKLLADANSWVQESQGSIHEWEAALQHTRMILENRDAFHGRARTRIKAVISAAVAPPLQESPPAPRPAPVFVNTVPVSSYQSGAAKGAKKRDSAGIILVVLSALGIAVLASGVVSQTGQDSSASGALPSVKPAFDPAVVKDLEGQADWYQTGDFYTKWVPEGQYTCTGTACVELWVQTPLYEGCKKVNVVVDMLRLGTVMGTYHGNATNLAKGEERKLHIEAFPGVEPDEVKLNRVTCLA